MTNPIPEKLFIMSHLENLLNLENDKDERERDLLSNFNLKFMCTNISLFHIFT